MPRTAVRVRGVAEPEAAAAAVLLDEPALLSLPQRGDDVTGDRIADEPPVEVLSEHRGHLHDAAGRCGQRGQPVGHGQRERLGHDHRQCSPYLPPGARLHERPNRDERGEELLDQEGRASGALADGADERWRRVRGAQCRRHRGPDAGPVEGTQRDQLCAAARGEGVRQPFRARALPGADGGHDEDR